MELYDAIFYRKSIKNYSSSKIKSHLIEEVKKVCSDITYLNEDLNIKAHVIDRGHLIHFLMGKGCKVKAPHYILVTSDNGEDCLQNIGFALEKVVLHLTTLGIATCWLECNLKREDILEFVELEEVEELNSENDEEKTEVKLEYPQAVIAFGYPEKSEHLFRNKEIELDRLEVKEISKKVDKKWVNMLEAVRFSPSIKNLQPWLFYNDKKGFHLYEDKPKKVYRQMSKVSMGVALRHFDIACENYNIDVNYSKIEAKKRMGKEYFVSIVTKDKEIEKD